MKPDDRFSWAVEMLHVEPSGHISRGWLRAWHLPYLMIAGNKAEPLLLLINAARISKA